MSATTLSRRRGRPPGPPVDPALRREELLDAAERVVARQGAKLALADVAAEAGYARTAVYAAFPDRTALVHALAERHTNRIIGAANAGLSEPLPARELLRSLIDLFCGFIEANPRLQALLMQGLQTADPSGGHRPLFVQASDWATDVFTVILDRLGADRALARTWACATVGAMLMAAEDWSRAPTCTRAELVERLVAFLYPAVEGLGGPRLVGPLAP